MDERLLHEEVDKLVKTMPGWNRVDDSIRKTYERKHFVSAMGFVIKVALLAEKADHHPDIDIRYNKIVITLSTHSAGGVTKKDFQLAKQIDDV